MRTLLLTLIVCLFVLPAYAKYSGGSGTAQDPYKIATAADLILLGETPQDYDKHFVMTADIDLAPNLPGRKVFDKAVIAPDTVPNGWSFDGTPFTGVFDGNGHTISHLTITGAWFLGLFGQLASGAEVKNLGVVDVNVNVKGSGGCVGRLVGSNGGTVTSCYSTGPVSGSQSVGGLIGGNGGTVTSCYSTGPVSGGQSVGGLIGGNGGTVTSCYSTGPVSGYQSVGGLVGENGGAVTQCYSTGAVSGYGGVGGLVGMNYSGAATQCHSSGAVSGNQYVGGLVGNNFEGTVTGCYSTGVVTGNKVMGGLVGLNGRSVLNSVWDTETSGLHTSAGGVGLTTAEMMDPQMLGLNGFANDPNWVLDPGRDYPRLAWEGMGGQIIPSPKIDWLTGRGTPEEPYRIDTADQLVFLSRASALCDRHFALDADIDLYANLASVRVFPQAVIPTFMGVFDGSGHTISHLTIKGGSSVGLFGYLGSGAEVKNLGVVDVSITGSGQCAGGLVGDNGGHVTNCYSTGTVSGTGNYVGGLVGSNGGTVTSCYSTGPVSGYGGVGGLVGLNGGTVTSCYSTGPVSGNQSVGGLVGGNRGTVTSCYSTGPVSGNLSVGGLVGSSSGGDVIHCYSTGAVGGMGKDVGGLVGYTNQSGRIWRSFWDIGASGRPTSAGGTGKTTAQMQDIQTFLSAGWDFVGEIENGTSQIWQMAEGGGYPVLAAFNGYIPPELHGLGTAEDPYLISNAFELGAMAYCDPSAHYRQAAPIDLSGIRWGTAVIARFAGTFDGNNLTISHLTIKGGYNLGLFGQLASGAEAKNLGVVDVNIIGSGDNGGGLVGDNGGHVTNCYSTGTVQGNDYVGGLVGMNWDWGTVTQCYSTGTVQGNDYVGGLVGENGGAVTQCYSTGTVQGNDHVGGLVGGNGMDGALTRCYSTGAVSGTGNYVGGLVGANYGGSVTQCYSAGAVSGEDYVGGLVGYNGDPDIHGGYITDSYSTGAVAGNDRIGGLVGYSGYGSTVAQCYSTGVVSGMGKDVGGLVGYTNQSGRIWRSFWDIGASGRPTSAGGTGKTTTEMQTAKIFLDAGWDFVGETKNGTGDVWWIIEGLVYPRLQWELGESLPARRAFAPYPVDGATDVLRDTILHWTHGEPSLFHDIYFGESQEAIAKATPEDHDVYRGRHPPAVTSYSPGVLEYGKTYYWRVDEVNESDPAGPRKGNVWSFTTTDCIKSPQPANGAIYVSYPPILSWVAAQQGVQYDVYLGQNEGDVRGATAQTLGIYRGRQTSDVTTYKPGDLKLNTTYYWRIDGVDKASPQSSWKGKVWSFTTVDFMLVSVVDDFESYTNDISLVAGMLFSTWIPGFLNGTGGGFLFAEQWISHGGKQSMPMDYNNVKKPWYSEAQRTWATPQDWTIAGADTLTLYFRGKADNGREPLYVVIEDSAGRIAVVVHPDAEAARATEWQKWHIALADVRAAGVDVAAVKKMVIGVGDRRNPKPGGTGKIYIDDIRLTKRMP